MHLLDVAIHGRHIQVVLRKKIRNEQRFASLDELKAQIARDELTAREFFRANKTGLSLLCNQTETRNRESDE